MRLRTLLLFLVSGLMSCSDSEPHFSQGPFHIHRIDESPIDNKIPAALWDKIEESQARVVLESQNEEDKVPEEKKGKASKKRKSSEADSELILKRFMPLRVYLKEKTLGVLGRKNHLLEYPPGGGNLDLAQYVMADRGTYFVGFGMDYAEEADDLVVYYSGQSKLRAIDGRTWGSGCQKYANITGYFKNELSSEGLKANATDRRDLSLLAGSYIFVLPRKDGLYLAQLGIYDSRVPLYHCSTSPVHLK